MQLKLSKMNEKIMADPYTTAVNADRIYEIQFGQIAEYIFGHHEQRPVILLSGPSGSGKTTTSNKIEEHLDALGLETHTISMDNYFLPLTAEDIAKKVDLESPTRIDTDLLNTQIEAIFRGETVELPTYDFATNTRIYTGKTLTRKPGELVIFEGIHALNPSVITLPDDNSTRIYVSVRTRIELDDGTLVHPTMIRLMRRMLRDQRFRNRPVNHSLQKFSEVQRGENRFVMPYKVRSMFDVDTFLAYEPALYRDFLLPELYKVKNQNYIDDMIRLLEQSAAFPLDALPEHSMLHEFIG